MKAEQSVYPRVYARAVYITFRYLLIGIVIPQSE